VSALVMLCASSVASAQWYGGVNVGRAKANVNQADKDSSRVAAATAQSLSEDLRETSYKIFGGYQLTS